MINEFICGNGFKQICDVYLDEYGYKSSEIKFDRMYPFYFVKTDFINDFFTNYKPKQKFILFTHNSDFHITSNYIDYLNDDNLITWYAQNVDVIHPKLKSIPIGIANKKWIHGNTKILNKVINEKNKKNNLIYTNFTINTNRTERNVCLTEISKWGLNLSQNVDFENYLRELSKSFFVISPNGNGVDCHKTWESLYLKTIPIVTESTNINFYQHLPIIVIKDWSSFDLNFFTEDLYHKIWNDFDPHKLTTKFFIENV
jgi:hypothetical protein